ncbi:uncharacterized protein LOC108733442 [Agrilus planipennis]|uniref:Uncharacterized protein LOC108733442 n=1 Tax=Agrilus planipennis TaxID=224129 RepID=A0A1W4W7Q1_AGRPL|nr:uncharacterized protein LOC108733442 [Agrilus planipennis]
MHGVPGSFWLLLHFILGLCCCVMVTVGLPTARQERGSSNDIVFGEDFVAILLDSPAEEDLVKINTSSEPSQRYTNTNKRTTDYSRQTRSTVLTNYYTSTTSPHAVETTSELNQYGSSTPEGEKVVVLGVSVSTSVGDSRNPEMDQTVSPNAGDDKAVIQTEYRPSIVAESSKSDFSVEESAPVTQDHDPQNPDSADNVEYPARVQSVPSPQALPLINSNSNLYQGLDRDEDKDNLSPYHHQTLIFHDNPHEPEKAKSVSYTSVIHSLPQGSSPKQWQNQDENKENAEHDRQERHYDANTNYGNNFYIDGTNKNVQLPSKENHNDDGSFTYTNSPLKSTPNEWKGLQNQQDVVETSTAQSTKSYDQPQDDQNKSMVTDHHRHHQQRIYGEPEKNYEVEESVSVLTNGRVHGVQPVASPKPSSSDNTKNASTKQGDNNQKVGYVVEGRNYRKYRVEERTPDGFIVGEYGVVSHNDGSLRGVRYTADGTINPRLIYDALMKFLSL